MRTIPSPLRRLAGVATVAALALTACTDGPAPSSAAPGVTPVPTSSSTPDPIGPLAVDWTDPDLAVELDNGWILRDCDGDAPLLCVHDGDDLLGVLEAGSSPLDDELAGILETEGVEATLRHHIAEHHGILSADRGRGCADGYRYEEHPTEPALLAGVPALRFGSSGYAGDAEVERNVNYITIWGGQLRSISAVANDPGSCVHSDTLVELRPQELARLQPELDSLVAGSVLPESTAIVDGTVLAIDGGLDGGLVYFVWQGRKQRIQQPRPMTPSDLTALGLRPGPAVASLVAGRGPGSYFVVSPPDGPDARLHVVIGDVVHPVLVQHVAPDVLRGMPDTTDLITRLGRSV